MQTNEVLYARLTTDGGFVEQKVDSFDISKIKISKDVFKVTFRRTWQVKVAVNNREKHSEKEARMATYYIGEIVTMKDALAGGVDRNSTAYSKLISGEEKQMLKANNGKIYKIEEGAIILSPADFVNGYYNGQNLNV